MSRASVGGVTGVNGAIVGGFLGYRQALGTDGVDPWQGALFLSAVGLVLGSAGGYVLRSVSAILVYVVLLGVLAYFFRDQIEALTGTDPIEAGGAILNDGIEFLKGMMAQRRTE